MCSLLSFLMCRTLSGMAATINEQEIGVEVFRRDARDFDTTTDPIVRVQMGRLRDRLALYNATCATPTAPQIEIPPGSYVPRLPVPGDRVAARRVSVELAPLRALGACGLKKQFPEGVEEELAVRMFQCFAPDPGTPARYRLEVSIRAEQRRVRASLRLRDLPVTRTVWMAQCDRAGELGIALQEQLAAAICDALQAYLTGLVP